LAILREEGIRLQVLIAKGDRTELWPQFGLEETLKVTMAECTGNQKHAAFLLCSLE